MKKLFIYLLFVFIAFSLKAQQGYDGQWIVNIGSGITDKSGFNIDLGIEKYIGNSFSSVRFGLTYLRTKQNSSLDKFDVNTVLFSGTYFYSLESVVKDPFYVNLGASLFIGFENMEKKELPTGVIQKEISEMVYGISLNPQFETILYKNVSVLFEPRINYFIKTEFDNILFTPILGIKIYM